MARSSGRTRGITRSTPSADTPPTRAATATSTRIHRAHPSGSAAPSTTAPGVAQRHAFHGRLVTGQPFAEGEEHDADDQRRGQPVLDPETDEAPDRDRDRDARLSGTPANADPDEDHADGGDDEGDPERGVVDHVLDVVHGP